MAVIAGLGIGARVSAEAIDIASVSDENTVQLSWTEASAEPVDDYTVELSQDGNAWFTYPDAVTATPGLTIPRNIFPNDHTSLDISVRITTLYSDTSTEVSNVTVVTIPPLFRKTTRFTIGTPETLVSNTDRLNLGLDQWMDGTAGFFERNNEVTVISSNGRDTSKITVGNSGFIGSVDYDRGPITGQAIASDHASGGPVYYDAANDRLLMFYHAEIHQPSAFDFYSYIGLAVSTDGGATFDDLGEIIRPEISVSDLDRIGAVDVGSATYIVKDGYFYVYFKDMKPDGTTVKMAVARSSVSDVLAAAASGGVSPWLKYSSGSFSTPGISGTSDNIMPIAPNYINWMDVVYLEQLGQYAMVMSSINNSTVGSMHYITTSQDGISWTVPETIYDSSSTSAELPYVTLTSPDYTSQRSVAGNEFELLRTKSNSGYTGNRWDDAVLERITISFETPPVNPPPQDLNGDSIDDNLQPNVGGYVSSITGKTVAIDVGEDCELTVDDMTRESSLAVQDPAYEYTNGLWEFEADCTTPGVTTTVKLYYYGVSIEDLVVRKYNPNTNAYFNIPGASLSQQTINNQSVAVATYQITEGGEMDMDGLVNGTIEDPAGVAKLTIGAPNTGIGGRSR